MIGRKNIYLVILLLYILILIIIFLLLIWKFCYILAFIDLMTIISLFDGF